LHPGAPIEAEELREFSRAKMASYKVPSILQIIKEFPMTRSANGDKVVKHRLRDMAREITR
jgi:fatty-acyl-CoA synthase